MTDSSDHEALLARLNEVSNDIQKEIDTEAETIRLLSDQDYRTKDPETWMYILGKHKVREETLATISALIMLHTDDLAGEVASFLASEQSGEDS